MLKFFFSIFIAWLLYKLVFDLLIPGYKVTKQVRRQMNDMQEHMRQQYESQQSAQPGQNPRPSSPPESKKVDKGDYLDFEEIK